MGKQEHIEPAWKISIFKIVDKRIIFYSQNTSLLPPKPKSTFPHLQRGIQEFKKRIRFGSSRQGRKTSLFFDGYTTFKLKSRKLAV